MWLLHVPILTFAAQVLIEDDPPQKADAILVLGGDEYGTRIVKAAQLQKEGYAPYVLVSGPPTLLGHESDLMIEFARRQGYPASIFRPINHNSDSTRSESALIGRYLRGQSVKTLLLVTSNYHTKRAARLMRAQNPFLHVLVVAAPDPFFTPATWWKTRTGEKTFTYEWLKTIAVGMGV